MATSFFAAVKAHLFPHTSTTPLKPPRTKPHSFLEMLRYNWYLGFTCFGGPAVHFQIVCFRPTFLWRGGWNGGADEYGGYGQFNKTFVEKYGWISDQMVRFGSFR